MTAVGRVGARVVGGATTARLVYGYLDRAYGGDADRLRRTNFRGRQVSLLGGVAFALASLGAVASDRAILPRVRVAATSAGVIAALAGGLDDVRGSGSARGLRGHLGALRHGEITTGAVKVAAIGAAGVVAGGKLAGGGVVRRLAAGVVVAGSANLANLLDVRPGRALKAGLLAAAPLAVAGGPGGGVAALVGGAAAGVLPADLAERVMLGDAGANCLGALVGSALVAGAPSRRVAAATACVVGLTLLSEVASFSQLIDASRPLRWLDRLGRLGRAGTARPTAKTADA